MASIRALYASGLYLPIYRTALSKPSGVPAEQWAALVGAEDIALANTGAAGRNVLRPDLKEASAQPAIPAIVSAARGRRVVMLNEAHHVSRHRAFLTEVLQALRAEGFTHLACETFLNDRAAGSPNISSFGRDRPFDPRSGFYTWDPVFAEAVRVAADLGYGFAAYEQRPDQTTEGLARLAAIAEREQAEAANLAELLAANPNARFVVYVGFSHLRKTPDEQNNRWFATRLKDETGIDPLSIGQSLTGSFAPHGKDSLAAEAVLARFNPQNSVVVRQPSGEVLGASREGADLAVFHPAYPDVAGRPGWLARGLGRTRVDVEVPVVRTSAPMLLQAINHVDGAFAVPADQVLLIDGRRTASLWLRPGAYRLRLETESGHVPLWDIRVRTDS